MSARDELMEDIRAIDGPALLGGDVLADGLIAAGYRKPRTITTAEELDALPNGTVVLSMEVRHHVESWPLAYQRWYDGDWHRGARAGSTHPDNFLPATVLHEPTP